jgi:hypothetical protein
MKKLVAFTSLITGILFILVPRYILPACEYEGFPHMHCSDTAQAEYIVGALLMALGALTFFFKQANTTAISSASALVLYCIALWLPVKIGYCQNSRMPCNYGMVPGIRFIAITGILIMAGAIIGIARSYRRKGNS